ncbi:cell surface protein [Drechmeria coniospora]|uniref:Cell surface protein n=1 Tax=Drechmeria coniospora TaxID=98403 RepID=A0A151GMZ5_DRECN|nr:cell surface protein [Drechmeria coniospora]KYK58479.1 cell surface protein [Drechmeria coniospora]ODA83874.1 hypothetical protein RJ55_02390 [Drechmeria coniospora]
MRSAIVYSAFVAGASAHGLWIYTVGANKVTMPGLNVADGTPRDCVVNACGAQADTAIIRDMDIMNGVTSPLGKTQGNGNVDPAAVISVFMGRRKEAPANKGAQSSVGKEDALPGLLQRREERKRQIGNLFSGIANLPVVGVAGLGGVRKDYPVETVVRDSAGQGAKRGLPTCDDDGVISGVYRQVNQDGAGPLTAAIDPSSGGYDGKAFQSASIVQNMPGLGVGGLSLATNTEFPIKVKMPEGMVCNGKVGGAENVCIVRVRNQAAAGPFGGSGAFTQSPAARKRAIAYRLKKRFDVGREDEE